MLVRLGSIGGILLLVWAAQHAGACSMCPSVRDTLSEKLAQADVAIVARLLPVMQANDPQSPTSNASGDGGNRRVRFRILRTLGNGAFESKRGDLELVCRTRAPAGTHFLLIGTDTGQPLWSEPIELSDLAVEYLDVLQELPSSSPERLTVLLPFTDSPDEMVADDAYSELARAPYADYVAMHRGLDRAWLTERIRNPDTRTYCRILYLMLLSVCGSSEDLPWLAEILRRRDQSLQPALQAAIACYLRLAGAEGMTLIEELFFKDRDAHWTDAYAAIVAVRYCGEEFDTIPRPRLAEGLRYLLSRPRLAEHVLADLARWGDWTIVDRLLPLFRDSSGDDRSVRVAIVQYLHACPLPEAKVHLEILRPLDPQSVQAAEFWYGLGSDTERVASRNLPATKPGDPKRVPTPPGTRPASCESTPQQLPWGMLIGGGALLVYLAAVSTAALVARRRTERLEPKHRCGADIHQALCKISDNASSERSTGL